MNIKEFSQLKERIEVAKTNKARAEGVLAKIEEEIKEKFGISIDEAEDKISKLKKEYDDLGTKKIELVDELEGLCDWTEI